MRTVLLTAVVFLAFLASHGTASAVVVVRHPVYRPVYHPVATAAAVATVAVVATAVAKPPSTPPPPPSAPHPPPVTTPLPIDSTMWVLPSGCLRLSVKGETIYQCGPSWLKQQQSDQGLYYQVVPPPTNP
jgi:hypothetical protein